jgi:signal transduction histidine kinase
LPILFGAFWYGLWGGLGIALVTSMLYLPHIVLHWGHDPLYRSNQFAEILLFLVIGSVAGLLTDRIRREREEHRRTAEELARAYEQLRATFERLRLVDRLSALGALSAGMAHEIRNPLGSIQGSIEILEQAVPEGDERREFVQILKKEIERLSRIVSDHLDLVRPGQPQRGPNDLAAIARAVVDDGHQMQQAILNLVLNALHAQPDGGEITLRLEYDAERVSVAVEDRGPGLGDEALGRVFEPFYTTKERGTGLGLSIAFQIADAHGGDLAVENRQHGGARFHLEIPVAPVAGPAGVSHAGSEA